MSRNRGHVPRLRLFVFRISHARFCAHGFVQIFGDVFYPVLAGAGFFFRIDFIGFYCPVFLHAGS